MCNGARHGRLTGPPPCATVGGVRRSADNYALLDGSEVVWACADVQGARCAHLPIGRYRGAYLLQHFGLDRIAVIDVPPPLTVFIHTTYAGGTLEQRCAFFLACADGAPCP